MKYINFLASENSGFFDLDSFAKDFFSSVGVVSYSERESGNYPGGRYYKGLSDGFNVIVSASDEEDNEIYPYWIQISGDFDDLEKNANWFSGVLEKRLLPAGFKLIRVMNFGKVDEIRIDVF